MEHKPNPKDSMKSTWFKGDKSQWNYAHHFIARSRAKHPEYDENIPVHTKTDMMPYMAQWSQHLFILTHSLAPIAGHQMILSATGWQSLSAWVVFPLYFLGNLFMLLRQSLSLRYLGHIHGYLDGDMHERDFVPDVGVKKVLFTLHKLLIGRTILIMILTYQAASTPAAALSEPTWWAWLTLQLGLYGIVLDFWFYWYHRAMHDVKPLWKYHRTHHLTKHPNPLLSGYADEEQELGDILVVPFLTFLTTRFVLGLPLDFYQFWICQAFILYAEALGHSGLRVFTNPPSMAAGLLRYFGVDLVIEDHDLHHRKGHRKSFNYGKQTRLWDYLFGTTFERYETQNVDFSKQVYMPIF